MKRIVLLFALHFSIVLMGYAQQIALAKEKHLPLVGDSIVLIEIPHKSFVISTGADCVWDFSNLIADSLLLEANYYAYTNDTTRIGHHFLHTHHQYEIDADTLWYIGFEEAKLSVNYIRKRKAMVFPFAYGNRLLNEFSGIAQYSHNKKYRIAGESVVHAEGWGKLVLSEFTFDSTLLVHSKHTYKSYLMDSANIVEDIFQWYHPNYRYPLFEVAHKCSSNQPNSPIMSYAFYHIPTDEHLQNIIDTKIVEADNDEIVLTEIDSVLTNICFYPNPVHDNLTITYRQARQANVFFSVHYNSGLCVYQSSKRLQNEGEYLENIPMSTMPVGAYVVYIHVDDKKVAANILKY